MFKRVLVVFLVLFLSACMMELSYASGVIDQDRCTDDEAVVNQDMDAIRAGRDRDKQIALTMFQTELDDQGWWITEERKRWLTELLPERYQYKIKQVNNE